MFYGHIALIKGINDETYKEKDTAEVFRLALSRFHGANNRRMQVGKTNRM